MICSRCKKPLRVIKDYVYKSSKDKMTKVGVCEGCYNRARTLKAPKIRRDK